MMLFARKEILYHAWIHLIPVNIVLAICDLLVHSLSRTFLSGYPIAVWLLVENSLILLLYHLLLSKILLFYWRIALIVVATGFVMEQFLFMIASVFCVTDPPLLLLLIYQLGLAPIQCVRII